RQVFERMQGVSNAATHKIYLTDDKPIKQRYYPRNPKQQAIIDEQVNELLSLDLIERSRSPYSAPVVLVRKKNNEWRMCIDYRLLNEKTEKDAYPYDEDKNERPIAFFSAKLNKSQLNYSVTEKKCLAAVLAVEKFRPYVELMPFTVITDYASLKWLMTMKVSGRLARWSLRLQSFDFQIAHWKGADNVVADTLSRCVGELKLDVDNALGFATAESQSVEYKEIQNEIKQNQARLPDMRVEGDLIFKRL
ncbi:hypothetical protein KR032_007969, partial [Drosophila birchii]